MPKFIDHDKATKNFEYDEKTGILYAKIPKGTRKAGDVVGGIHECGSKLSKKYYLRARFDGAFVYIHRIIYVIKTGKQPETIDHIDGNGLNNKWENLRSVPHRLNGKNQQKHKTNTSGTTGVCYRKDSGKWRARIMVDDKMINLGSFKNKEDAISARAEAELKYQFNAVC